MGMGFTFSSNTLGFLIIGTEILRKIRLGNGIETPFPPLGIETPPPPPFRALLLINIDDQCYIIYKIIQH